MHARDQLPKEKTNSDKKQAVSESLNLINKQLIYLFTFLQKKKKRT